MKVYRGYDNEIGPISHRNWIYVTPSIEHAKWYATKDGFVKDGAIIEYDMDKDNMSWISLSKINSFAEQYDEEYTEEDLLWYQEDLANDLSQFRDGIVFQDPYDKNHTIYIVLNEKCLKNGRILSKEEFDKVQLKESEQVSKSKTDILKNPTLRDLNRFSDVYEWRILQDLQGNYYFADALKYVHSRMERELVSKGIEAVRADEDNYGITHYSVYDNAFYYRLLGVATKEDIEKEYNNSYLSKAFPNAKLKQSNDDTDDELDEQINDILNRADVKLDESANKSVDFTAYHGGVEPDMTPQPKRALYLTDSFELAHKFARREIWNDGLYEGEIPTVFTFKGHFNNPYYMTLDEYNDEGQDSNIDIQKWLDKGIDGIIIPPNEEGSTTYYIVIDLSTIKLIDKKVFYDEADIEELNETREDLTKFNRIAGFYHYDTKQFELFPRTSEDISVEDDEVNDYIHNVHSKDEFTEFNIVRFGIEDIPGEGVVCYIEGDTKRNVEKCYYAILEKYAEECDIIKYELEYYVGNEHKYIFLDRYGEQLMETVKPVNKELADTKLITSTYEMNEYLKNHTASRFVYDTERDWYLVGDAENSIHIEMINDALLDGVYPAFEWNGHMLPNNNHYEAEGGKVLYNLHPSRFLLFRTSADPNDFMEFTDDRYNNCYYYPDYCVFDRSNEFKETPLYKLLGKPEYIEHWNGKEFEQLNETLVHAERDEDGDLINEIWKNPTRKELEKIGYARVVIDYNTGDFYFCLAGALIHDDMIDKIGKGDNYSLFYNYYKNTFYKRDEYRNTEEHKKMNKRLKEWLLEHSYIKNTFGTNFNAYVFSYEYGEDPFDIKIEKLDESQQSKLNDNFWKWFGNSKCADENGNPVIYYHATNEDFNVFDNKKIKKGKGFWFTNNKQYALEHGRNVISVYLRTNNVFDVDLMEDVISKYTDNPEDLINDKETQDKILKDGYDSIAFNNKHGRTIIVFNSNQIKSVKNGGRWDGSSNNIYESIIHAKSSGDKLTDIILKNPTRKELEDNHIERARCMEDDEGNWYFCDLFNNLHYEIENLLRDNVGFPYFDGNDSYGISYYDAKANEFWYNSNEMMPKEKCVAQYYESPYLSKTFPNAYIRSNPYGENDEEEYDEEEIELDESVIKRDDGEIEGHYTQSTNEMLSIIDNKYPENDIRVLYDIDRKLYIFADTYSAIHFNLILYMILFTNIYDDIPEIRDNKYSSDETLQDIVKSKLYLASFKIFRNYTNDSDKEFIRFLKNTPENATDSYDTGYACKINDKLWAICRNDEIGEAKQVPLLKNKVWIDLSKADQLNEDVDYVYETEILINPEVSELHRYIKRNKEYRAYIYGVNFYVWNTDTDLMHDEVCEELNIPETGLRFFIVQGKPTFWDYQVDTTTFEEEEIKDYYDLAYEADSNLVFKKYFPNHSFKSQLDELFKDELDESIFWKGEKINNYEQGYYPYDEGTGYDKDDEMIVWKNPSAEWIRQQMNAGNYFRFVYDSVMDNLYVWYGEDGFHADTMEITSADGDVVGTMTEGGIDYWPDDNDSPEVGDRVFRQKREQFLKTIYPNGYETGVQY